MIKFVLVAFTGLFFAFSASADPIFGLWQTVGDDNGIMDRLKLKLAKIKSVVSSLNLSTAQENNINQKILEN